MERSPRTRGLLHDPLYSVIRAKDCLLRSVGCSCGIRFLSYETTIQLNEERARLQSLLDEDPAQAIREARALPLDKPVRGVLFTSLKASILVDGGSYAKDEQAIQDGIVLFRELLKKAPKRADFQYNLANGLVALADQVPYIGYHCCPARSRTESTDCRCRINRYRSRMPEVPVKWAFSRKE